MPSGRWGETLNVEVNRNRVKSLEVLLHHIHLANVDEVDEHGQLSVIHGFTLKESIQCVILKF